MASKEQARASAEARFAKAKKQAEAGASAMKEYTAAAAATVKNTARLKSLRLAKEAADLAAEPATTPTRKKKSAT